MSQEESNSNPNALDESRPLLTDHSRDIVSIESRDGPSKPINLISFLFFFFFFKRGSKASFKNSAPLQNLLKFCVQSGAEYMEIL